MKNFKLFTPGPVEMSEEIRAAGSLRLPYMRTKEFSEITLNIADGLKKLLETKGEVAVFASSGTGAMEAVVVSMFDSNDRVLVINGGLFGKRWLGICQVHHIKTDVIEVAPDADLDLNAVKSYVDQGITAVLINAHETSTGHLYDIEALGRVLSGTGVLLIVDAISTICADPFSMDRWGVDVTIASSNKGLALPPGLSFVALSPRTAQKAKQNPRRSYYFHIPEYLKDITYGLPFTPPISIMLQLQIRLEQILKQGLKDVIDAHRRRAEYFRNGIKDLPLSIFPARSSNAVTSLEVLSKGVSAVDIVQRLETEYGFYVAPNQPPLKDKVFRVSHLGEQTNEDLDVLISGIKNILER